MPVNSNTVVQDGIEYCIETNKVVYDLGEDVEILYTLTNQRSEALDIRGLAPMGEIAVEAREAEGFREVWVWYGSVAIPGGPVVLELESGESDAMSGTWPQIDFKGNWHIEDDTDVLPGQYRVVGRFGPTSSIVGVDIAIIPEPGSLALFAVGLLFVRQHNRRQSG